MFVCSSSHLIATDGLIWAVIIIIIKKKADSNEFTVMVQLDVSFALISYK